MNAVALSSMTPALPEIVLALGAMALLMLGAYRGERSDAAVNVLPILLLIAAALIVAVAARPASVVFGGSFVVDDFARFLKLLALCRLGRRHRHVARLSRGGAAADVRISRS